MKVDEINTKPILTFINGNNEDNIITLFNIISLLQKSNDTEREDILNMLFSDIKIEVHLNSL